MLVYDVGDMGSSVDLRHVELEAVVGVGSEVELGRRPAIRGQTPSLHIMFGWRPFACPVVPD